MHPRESEAAGVPLLVAHPSRAVAEALAARLVSPADRSVPGAGTATTAAEALALLAARPHRLALAATSLPAHAASHPVERDAASVGRLVRLLRDARWAPDVALFGPADERCRAAAARAGARGWLAVEGTAAAFAAAVAALLRGEVVLGPATAAVVAAGVDAGADDPALDAARRVALLTDREREVLRHLTTGLPPAAIARLLIVSPATVRTHVERVRRKLGARSAIEAVAVARRATPGESVLS